MSGHSGTGIRGPREGGGGEERAPCSPVSFPADGLATEPESVFALDVLRQRLHEKIQEARGQVGGQVCWSAVTALPVFSLGSAVSEGLLSLFSPLQRVWQGPSSCALGEQLFSWRTSVPKLISLLPSGKLPLLN